LIATAVGHARVTGTPTVAFVGDISLLHDLGSLALVSASTVPVIIVVVNNDGGGIFHFLPLVDHPNMLEPWTTAPHGLNFSAAAKMFGLHYNSPTVRGDLADNLGEALQRAEKSNRSTLIEVRTNRIENVQFHRTLQGEIIAALHLSGLVTQSTAEVNNQ
jgi:2-succinyl-5-enolpyruvyl-6-hydroxy-3-cyclohexene-1-carboxylate synthase